MAFLVPKPGNTDMQEYVKNVIAGKLSSLYVTFVTKPGLSAKKQICLFFVFLFFFFFFEKNSPLLHKIMKKVLDAVLREC